MSQGDASATLTCVAAARPCRQTAPLSPGDFSRSLRSHPSPSACWAIDGMR